MATTPTAASAITDFFRLSMNRLIMFFPPREMSNTGKLPEFTEVSFPADLTLTNTELHLLRELQSTAPGT